MANIIIAHEDGILGDDLRWLLEDEGHTVTHYQSPQEVSKLYNNIPEYDVAIVGRYTVGYSDCEVIDGKDLIQKLKKLNPKKKVICHYTTEKCDEADLNLGIMDQPTIERLLKEVK